MAQRSDEGAPAPTDEATPAPAPEAPTGDPAPQDWPQAPDASRADPEAHGEARPDDEAQPPQGPSLLAGGLTLGLVSLVLMALSARAFGLWEPWETSWAEVAREVREAGRWFYPTLSQQPVSRPLLPVWLIALGQGLGDSELAVRLPLGLFVTAGAVSIFAWLRRVFGGWSAMLAAAAALTCPMVFLSGTTLAGNGALIGALMMTFAAFGALQHRPENTPATPWLPLALGGALTLDALAWGLWGLWLPLAVMISAGLAERFTDEEPDTGRALGALGAALACGLGTLGWAWSADFAPATTQLASAIAPPLVLACGVAGAWGTRALSPLRGTGAALILLPPALIVTAVAVLHAQASPGAGITGAHPTLTFLLENHLLTPSALPEHVTFDFWVRQIGFAAYPWTALLPLGLATLLVREEDDRRAHAPRTTAMRLLALWFFVAVAVAFLLGTVHERYLFAGVPPMGILAALALTDRPMWAWLRQRPLLMRALGFTALMIILFLSKDFDRYPKELLGPLLTDGRFEAPADFTFGRALKVVRYGLLGATALWLLDALSWPAWLQRLIAARKGASSPTEEKPESLPAKLSTLARRPEGLALAVLVGALAFVTLAGVRWVPELSHHLSNRGLIETWRKMAAPGEPLLSFQVGGGDTAYYLSDIDRIETQADLKERFKNTDERFFVIIPRDRLGSLNYEVRRVTEPRRDIHVVDDRSSRYLLATNILRDGEAERSLIAHAILPERPKPVYRITPNNEQGERMYPQFDGKVQLIGYEVFHEDEVDLYGNPTPEALANLEKRKAAGHVPVFEAGEQMIIRYHFKVLKRITASYKIFLHVDYGGARLNGDHTPVDEELPTTWWLPGDYLVDTQRLPIEPGTQSGMYKMYMGFFLGSRRMKVTPPAGHDGADRVELGTIEIKSF